MSSVYRKFLNAAQSQSFLEAAAQLLRFSQSPEKLAECAAALATTHPGFAYYEAQLWGKVDQLCKRRMNGTASAFLQKLCKDTGTAPSTARRAIRRGECLRNLEARDLDTTPLVKAPQVIFDHAAKRGDQEEAYLLHALDFYRETPTATPAQINGAWCRKHGSVKANLDIIKPSDWWAFGHPKWRQDLQFPGSIPGEVYANALYYFAPERGVAVDPMAGSGMLRRVYDDRHRWQKDVQLNLDLHLFDLNPQGRPGITFHNAEQKLPITADWIFLDPPYYGQSDHLYFGALARATNYSEYLRTLQKVLQSMAASLNPNGRLCLLLPKWSGQKRNDENHDLPADACAITLDTGLEWRDTAYVSRGRQQTSRFAFQNVAAKRNRRMLSDVCVLNVFEKPRA